MLQPVRRRTWAPEGDTPVQRAWDRHDRLSVLSTLTLAPVRRRFGLYFLVSAKNITAEDIFDYVAALRHKLRKRIILVLDRWSVHRKAVRYLLPRYAEWLTVEWLPAYAPDLNPTEHVWGHTKYGELANFIPDDVVDLRAAIELSLQAKHGNGHLMRSFFRKAKLAL